LMRFGDDCNSVCPVRLLLLVAAGPESGCGLLVLLRSVGSFGTCDPCISDRVVMGQHAGAVCPERSAAGSVDDDYLCR
jgi:hypothetical protein